MTDNTASHVQQNLQAQYKKMVDDGLARMGAMLDTYAQAEKKAAEQFAHQIDEMARLQKDAFAQMLQLNTEWRKMVAQASKSAVEMTQAQGN